MKPGDLVKLPSMKIAIRDLAVAMVEENLRYIDLTVGGPPGTTSITVRVFLRKAMLANGTEILVGKKRP